MAKCTEKLGKFIDELDRWGKAKFLWKEEESYVHVFLYTDGNRYCIRATDTEYLGCTVSARKPRPGEDRTRGNDLADGKFTEETWNKILRDIIAYELKTISDYVLHPEERNG